MSGVYFGVMNTVNKTKTYYITFQSEGNLLRVTQDGQGFFEACRIAMDSIIKMDKNGGWEIVDVHKKEEE